MTQKKIDELVEKVLWWFIIYLLVLFWAWMNSWRGNIG